MIPDKYQYILPHLQIVEYIDDPPGGIFSRKHVNDFSELYIPSFTIIISEPGNGKSRLLKEVILKSNDNNKKGIFIDLKRIGSRSIEEAVNEFLSRPNDFVQTNEGINKRKDYFYSGNFTINRGSSDIIVCLDALDEIRRDDIFDIVEKIKSFKINFPSVQVILSCRKYIYKEYESIFKDYNPKVIQVLPLDYYRAKDFLIYNGFQEDDIATVTNRFYRNFELNIINSPRILEFFIQIKKRKGIHAAVAMSKAELLEQFIYGELKEEDEKLSKNQTELIKRVLEKLALIMQIYQRYELSKDELMTFFDDVDSNLGTSFLQQVDINLFYDRALLATTADGQNIQFQNAEFQEYLAAKEISRMGRLDQTVFDLVVEKNLREIYDKWVNTLKYLIELYPEFQIILIDYVCRSNNSHGMRLLDNILLTEYDLVKKMQIQVRSGLFQKLFAKYQSMNWYLYYSMAEKLALLFTASDADYLMRFLGRKGDDKSVLVDNTVFIIERIMGLQIEAPIDDWKKYLISYLKTDNVKSGVKIKAINALVNYYDLSLLKDNFDYQKETDPDVIYYYAKACSKIDPNSAFTIEVIIHSIKDRQIRISSRPNFDDVNSKTGILCVLDRLKEDQLLREKFRYESYNYNTEKFADNIAKVFDTDVKNKLTELILAKDTFVEHDLFIQNILKIIKEKDTNYLFELIGHCKSADLYNKRYYLYNGIFNLFLSTKNINKFVEEMKSIPDSDWRVANLLFRYQYQEASEKQEIYEISKKYYDKEFKTIEDQIRKNNAKWDQAPRIYKDFLFKLEPEQGMYMTDVFAFYSNHKEVIQKYIQADDREKMKKLLTETVLKFDFKNANVNITAVEPNSRTYTSTSSIHIFREAVPLFSEFGIDTTAYKFKIIEYLPYAFAHSGSKIIFDLLGELNSDDINSLIDFYSTPRQDDLLKVNVDILFEICRHYKLTLLIPIIQKIVFDNSFEEYKRSKALMVIRDLKPDFAFYKKVFDHYKMVQGDGKSIAMLANEYLLQFDNQYRREAVEWRINEILSNPQILKLKDDKIDALEIEHLTNKISHPLRTITEVSYKDIFINALKPSIDLYNKGTEYHSYAAYIWGITTNYFDTLRIYKSFSPIYELETEINKYNKFSGYRLLLDYYNKIKINYVNDLGKPASLNECIKKYNELKQMVYNPISTATDFYYMIKDVIERDIKKWVEQEGAYKFMTKVSREEDLIQKTLKTQLENGLLRKGLRENEVRIRREEQLLDDKRTDFVISYGFIAQILIEIKLTKNPEVTDAKYIDKLLQYVDGTQSDYGIFLIFQTTDDVKYEWEKIEPIVVDLYKNHVDKIKIIGLNCMK